MNRTDRLLAIVLELQAKGWQRAEDLAATFEVTKRTIYRDMLALLESGVPVVSVPGQGYSLVEGYFLPPLSFTTDQALMLLLGADFIAEHFDAQYRAAADTANTKIRAVLSEKLRNEVDYLQQSIHFVSTAAEALEDKLRQLRRAIIQRRTVRFEYNARFSDSETPTIRSADPYSLIYVNQTWYLAAYCHLRNDMRNFRLERIDSLTVIENTFERRSDVRFRRDAPENRPITIKALFDHESVRWMRESPSYFETEYTEHADGVLVTFQVRQEAEIFQWLLGWGRHIRVLEPVSLRERLAEEAKAILDFYKNS